MLGIFSKIHIEIIFISDEKYSKWKLQLKCQHNSSFAFSSRSIERTKCIFHSILYPHNTRKWKKIEEQNYIIENCNENNNNCYDYIFSHQLHWKDGNAFPIHTGGLLSWYQSCKRRHSAHWAQHTTAHEQCLSFIFLHHVDSHFSDTISETWIKSCKTRWILGILLKVWLGFFSAELNAFPQWALYPDISQLKKRHFTEIEVRKRMI